MNKLSWFAIVIALGAFLLGGTIPAAAKPPEQGEGYLEYIPTLVKVWVSGGNTFMTTTEVVTYYGAMSGSFTDVSNVVMYASGNWTYRAVGTFVGTVSGKSGSLEMMMLGTRPDAFSEWQGTWVILSGTGALKNLHGEGTFWGLGYTGNPPEAPGRIDYAGKMHFDPE